LCLLPQREGSRLSAETVSRSATLSTVCSAYSDGARRNLFPVILLLQEIIDDANFEAGSRNRSVRLLSFFPRVVNGSTDLLRSAMENVIRHAVNYTAEGSEVELALGEEDKGT
jgi:two-component system, OmpR family, sensor kinase